ncbi:glycosyltransferase family 2 protein [Veillonellaceae bacterium WCA-693-APC-5D-A]|uniref:Glycosyltransferase family 2 protein n=1 Tax=Anaerovibrio slackiae TaxID=2652309 RepID=A0A6I2UD07_9FIRM|nr:glycosyltransferase [Anaerovibrio slackiae]MSU07580.1 glycosyltransferase family 2 protein [Anaerovibrio slackiae]
MYKVAIVIPTCNAGREFANLLAEIARQSLPIDYKLVIDSTSADGTADVAGNHGWQVRIIPQAEFSHGGTRQMAVELLPKDIEIVVFLTQDVRLPDRYSLEKLLGAFVDDREAQVAAAYGRQVPHEGASIYAAVDREFNYPAVSRTKSMADSRELGIKTTFLSDSFAAYRVQDLLKIGGFPKINICEDMYVAGRLLLAGKRIAYVAEAIARHSHEPKLKDMWCRYREMGRFQKENPWIGESFGRAGGEGVRLVKYQAGRVYKEKGIIGIGKILSMDLVRFLAYKAGMYITEI